MKHQDRTQPTPGGRERVFSGTGVPWGFVAFVVLAAAAILFIAQNTERVRVEWALWDFETSLAAVVLLAMLTAVVLTSIVGLVWRRSRRRMLTERERVERLSQEVRGLHADEGSREGAAGPARDDAPGAASDQAQQGSSPSHS